MTPARRKQLAVYLRQERAWMKPADRVDGLADPRDMPMTRLYKAKPKRKGLRSE
jgi:hypothetical protein